MSGKKKRCVNLVILWIQLIINFALVFLTLNFFAGCVVYYDACAFNYYKTKVYSEARRCYIIANVVSVLSYLQVALILYIAFLGITV